MIFMRIVVTAGILIGLMGCSIDLGQKKEESTHVNGKTSADYFGQFVSNSDPESCRRDSNLKTITVISLLGTGENLAINLVLWVNSTFKMDIFLNHQKVVWTGTWGLDGTELVLSSSQGEARLTGVVLNGVETVSIKVVSSPEQPALLDRGVSLYSSKQVYDCQGRF